MQTEAPLAPTPEAKASDDAAMARFLAVMAARGMELYPEQEEAILELFGGSNVILNTPTGSGKSLVASAFHYKSLCAGWRSVYTCPIKALVNEKFLALCREFGPENVGMMTGDASVNLDAPVLCCTAEVLANIALCGGERAYEFDAVIMDEFHYYSDASRGTAWQVPLLLMPKARFLLMSATLGHTGFIESEMTRVTGKPSVTVRSDRRPVPLEFEYSETPLQERVQALLADGKAPVYLVYFTQRDVAEAAQAFMSIPVASKAEKEAIAAKLVGEKFNSPYGKEVKRWLRHGIGVHHAGLLPRYRILVETLARAGLLKLVCGTDTLGVGINIPLRTVVFTRLYKFDGSKAGILSVRDFRQIAGRAGRRGYDTVGHVVVQAPEHVIANKVAEEKAAAKGKSGKVVKQKAPEGSVGWDEKTFDKLMTAPAESLTSRFEVTHGMLLNVLAREEDGCAVMKNLIRDSHETAQRKKAHRARAWQLFRSLLDRKIIEWIPRTASGRKLRVNRDLQEDFSLHHALSLYLIDTLPKLDRESPDHPFDLLSLCEAIVEDPEPILRQQISRLKGEELVRMKEADIPYEERMAKLEEIEHPKPLREFTYETFNAFAAAHPWVAGNNIKPKNIAREMYEDYRSFSDYIKEYGLERVEGLLLRHLSQVYKVLAQTVPAEMKTEPVVEMEEYFGELIRNIDSSLLEEWERMRNPAFVAAEAADKPARPSTFDITRDEPGFRKLVRAQILGFLQSVASHDHEAAAERVLIPDTTDTDERRETNLRAEARRIELAFAPYFDAYGRFRLDPEGRSAKHTHFAPVEHLNAESAWEVSQTLVDHDDENERQAVFSVDLTACRKSGEVRVSFVEIAGLG